MRLHSLPPRATSPHNTANILFNTTPASGTKLAPFGPQSHHILDVDLTSLQLFTIQGLNCVHSVCGSSKLSHPARTMSVTHKPAHETEQIMLQSRSSPFMAAYAYSLQRMPSTNSLRLWKSLAGPIHSTHQYRFLHSNRTPSPLCTVGIFQTTERNKLTMKQKNFLQKLPATGNSPEYVSQCHFSSVLDMLQPSQSSHRLFFRAQDHSS